MNKKIIIGGLILIAIAFYGGMVYGQSKAPVGFQGARVGNFAPNQNGVRNDLRAGGGFANGEIISKDATGITIKMQNGSTKIVLVSASIPVLKTVTGTQTDLVIGKQISATGVANADGSITADSIQIRQATTTNPQ